MWYDSEEQCYLRDGVDFAKVYTATSARRFRQLPRTRLLYSASYGIMTLHHRALSNLVVGGLVLEGRVAGVVLVLIS